ncbi:MAG: DUF4846 domain-containing protein [Ferruginibacter sp.]
MNAQLIPALLLFLVSCKNSESQTQVNQIKKVYVAENENPYADIASIPIPAGYKRFITAENSFSKWLGHVRLKKDKTVYLFDGSKKINQSAQFAVLDIPVGNKNLQQCADAVMRLRASYLYDQKKFDSIIFYDNEGKHYTFSKPYTPEHFNEYLQLVFGMCGTASLSKHLKKIDYTTIEPGDVLIRGGFPGHAVIVMDVVINNEGQKKYLLAQSYMPAQDIHVLLNPADENSPWYDVTDDDSIITPEYTFYPFELKRW